MHTHVRSEQFRLLVEGLMTTHRVPGLTIAITHNNTESAAAFGFADVRAKTKCDIDTIFDIASSSKSMTAAAIALLARDQRYPEIRFEAKMTDLLPEDFVMPRGYEDVTLEDIIAHRSGMADHYSAFLGVNASETDTPRSVTRNIRNLEPAAPLRTEFIYCNMMYTVMTHLIEVKTGESFSDFLEEHFFTPLGMKSTALQPSRLPDKGVDDKMAKAHVWNKDTQEFAVCSALESPEAQGAGCIMSTAPDYLKWVKAMMKKEGPVTAKIHKDLTKSRSITRSWQRSPKKLLSPDLYTAGLEVSYYRGYQIFGHDGAVDGFGSRHFWVPAFGLGCVILGNGTDTGDIGNVIQLHLIDELLGIPEDQRVAHDASSDSGSNDADEEEEDEILQKAIKRVYRGIELKELELPLKFYTGKYWNQGYRGLTVQIRENCLFIDANDRSLPLELVITHVSDTTLFIAHQRLGNSVGGVWERFTKVQFRWEGDRVVGLGLDWEERIPGGMIWFDKVAFGD